MRSLVGTSNKERFSDTYIFHIIERGFMTVTPWKLRSMGLNENRLHAGQLREGARVSIRNFDTVTEYTKAPDYLQVCLFVLPCPFVI